MYKEEDVEEETEMDATEEENEVEKAEQSDEDELEGRLRGCKRKQIGGSSRNRE